MSIFIRSPKTEKEYLEYFHFRWKMLRHPYGGKPGTEKDNLEDNSFHIMLTEFGKIIDPVADKICLVVVLIYLIDVYQLPFLIFFIVHTVAKAKSMVTFSSFAGALVPPRIDQISSLPLISLVHSCSSILQTISGPVLCMWSVK